MVVIDVAVVRIVWIVIVVLMLAVQWWWGGVGGGGGESEAVVGIVVTTGIKPSSNIDSALVSAMYGRSSELGLYLWGNQPLPTVQEHPPLVSSGWLPPGG